MTPEDRLADAVMQRAGDYPGPGGGPIMSRLSDWVLVLLLVALWAVVVGFVGGWG